MLTSGRSREPKNRLAAYYRYFELDNIGLKLLGYSFFAFWYAMFFTWLASIVQVPTGTLTIVGVIGLASLVLLVVSFAIVGYVRFRYRFTVNESIALSINEIVRIKKQSPTGILNDDEREQMRIVFRNLRRSLLRYKDKKLMFGSDKDTMSNLRKNLGHIRALLADTDLSRFGALEGSLAEMSASIGMKSTGAFLHNYRILKAELDSRQEYVDLVRAASRTEALKKIPTIIDNTMIALEKIAIILNRLQSIIITVAVIVGVLIFFGSGDFDKARSLIEVSPIISLPN